MFVDPSIACAHTHACTVDFLLCRCRRMDSCVVVLAIILAYFCREKKKGERVRVWGEVVNSETVFVDAMKSSQAERLLGIRK